MHVIFLSHVIVGYVSTVFVWCLSSVCLVCFFNGLFVMCCLRRVQSGSVILVAACFRALTAITADPGQLFARDVVQRADPF